MTGLTKEQVEMQDILGPYRVFLVGVADNAKPATFSLDIDYAGDAEQLRVLPRVKGIG